ncbi:DNA adenine methylase [Arthrobacter sp. PM3]|nr:DNA adenine methylase [Arthrobacter sp. PM3]
MSLPQKLTNVQVPPIKIQGIKTKLVSFIAANIMWDGVGTYHEPFMGSGVVGFNLAPQRAIFSDTNPHLIRFYQSLYDGKITAPMVREYLETEAPKLADTPDGRESYYYEVRDRFNKEHSPLDFLFLQRSNFNGMIRFNSSGGYNVPFGRKPNRFAPALITKITNQVRWLGELFQARPDWTFANQSFEDAYQDVEAHDFVYLDPPYIGRHDGYFDSWSEEKADLLAEITQKNPSGYALSMWHSNRHRTNGHLDLWAHGVVHTTDHFYHVGAKELNRSAVIEALVVSPKNTVDPVTTAGGSPRVLLTL